ncbi:MAG TPA: F0F1 ATP synthase subunit epsilon [Candidatus Sulfotelmatobacter sp.]|jgi:F-type H+-transporting ATPase subunit epsilon|nr:F0F1 ATP synthase subunit epsilon [Candidatus Sulfotelmatobacter sp.]
MLPESIQLIVVTPERQLLRESVVEVTVPGLDGQLGILPGHAPLMTELGIGELAYRTSTSSQPIVLAVISGFAEVLPDRVTVLAETAERAEEIDLARAEEAKARAEKRLAAGDTNIDWDRANIALQRSIIRIQIARKYRGAPVESR